MTEADSPHLPYLTVVVTGRNDDLVGDVSRRLFRALRFNHERLAEAGVSHEFVFVEWRPIEGKPLLATVLANDFRSLDQTELRCYVVHPSYHDALSLNPRLQSQEFIAKNVGIRRARGHFVLTTNPGVYFSRGVIDCLVRRTIERGVLYHAASYDLKSNADITELDWSVLEDPRNREVVDDARASSYANASGDFLLLDRDAYCVLRGFNEIYRVADAGVDENLCAKAGSSGLDVVDIGSPVYRVGQRTQHAREASCHHRTGPLLRDDMRWTRELIYVNGPSWGLASAPERSLDSQATFLDFDWSAVGPMVSLRRFVLPINRWEKS